MNSKETAKNEQDALKMKKNKAEIRRVLRNVFIISISFTLLFTAYQSTANLQSSLNSDAGLGTASFSTVYGALVVSCIFVPTFLMSKLGVKWTLCLCMLGYTTYIGAQFSPSFYSLIPTAIIVGLGAAPMWSAKCTYLTHVGTLKAKLEGQDSAPEVTRLFGIFFLFFQSAQVIGNLISSTVLSSGNNLEIDPNDPGLNKCGATFCPWESLNGPNNTRGPELSQIYTLNGIYLACSIGAAMIVAIFVDPLTRFGERTGSGTGLAGWQLLTATIRQIRDPRQMLLIPLTIFSGLEQGYISADFTQGFVTCAYGVHNVGYVMICFGVCDALFSMIFGALVKKIGRVIIFSLGATINFAMVAMMFLWQPNPSEPVVFFVLAGMWGISDAVWQTQINALYGVLFVSNEEASFSNYRLWESLGFIIAYAYSTFLCVNAKLWVVAGSLVLGMIGYYTVEIIERRKKNLIFPVMS